MLRHDKKLAALFLLLGAGLGGCLGRTSTVTLDEQTARLEFGVVAVRIETGDASIVDFCVVLNDSICSFPGGEVLGCGLDVSISSVQVYCQDPLLAEWPNTWSLQNATWSAPSVPAAGSLIVEPANIYQLPAGFGIITDPGFSAWVLRLDVDTDFGPADVDVTLVFDHGGDTQVSVKAVDVLVAELQTGERVVIPTADPLVDFPSLGGDNELPISPSVATEGSTWSRLKSLFR